MKRFLYYTIILLGILAIIITGLSAIATENFWWIKVVDFPRIQISVLLIILFLSFLGLKRKWGAWNGIFVGFMVFSLCIQIYYLYPYTGLVDTKVESISAEEAPAGSTFDLMVANVYQKNRKIKEFLQIVEDTDPDLLLAMETNEWWEEALQPLDEQYAYGMEYPLDNTYGMILYSKFPLSEEKIRFLQYDSVPSFHASVHLPNGKVFKFHGVHPVPPFPGEPNDTDDKEISLVKVGSIVASQNLPAVVAGDLNDVAWAQRETLFEHPGLLDDVRIGRGIYSTFSAKSLIMKWPLDYVFVTREFGVVEFDRLPEFGSDHFPIYIKMSLLK